MTTPPEYPASNPSEPYGQQPQYGQSQPPAYGYLWWLNRYGEIRGSTDQVDAAGQPVTHHDGRLVPDAPANLFSAIGLGGQIAMVDPASRTIVVRLGPGQPGPEGAYGLRNAARVVTWASD